MIHLTTSTSTQNFNVIPRRYATSCSMTLTDEQTNVSTSVSPTLSTVRDYLNVSATFSLKEGHTYEFKLTDSSGDIYRDKIFCTDQTINQINNSYYSINTNEYTEPSEADNEYLVYE